MHNSREITVDYNWQQRQHFMRMKETFIPKLEYEYISTGRRKLDRPRYKATDQQPW